MCQQIHRTKGQMFAAQITWEKEELVVWLLGNKGTGRQVAQQECPLASAAPNPLLLPTVGLWLVEEHCPSARKLESCAGKLTAACLAPESSGAFVVCLQVLCCSWV